MEVEIRSHLIADTDLNNLVGTRIYPLTLPRDPTFPAITYQLISNPRGEWGTKNPRYQFSVYSKNYGETVQTAEALKNALSTIEGLADIFANYDEDETEQYEAETGIYTRIVDAIFYYATGETW